LDCDAVAGCCVNVWLRRRWCSRDNRELDRGTLLGLLVDGAPEDCHCVLEGRRWRVVVHIHVLRVRVRGRFSLLALSGGCWLLLRCGRRGKGVEQGGERGVVAGGCCFLGT
jgi:hypothetical protein